jgi:hypothetical protein
MSRFARALVRHAPLRGALALACALLGLTAHADSEQRRITPAFDRLACYDLVRHEGRRIAWARWEKGYSLERTRAGHFADGTPAWMLRMLDNWISDAYSWQVTDAQIHEWAAELGNTANLPSTTGLSRHETIAIWMRRIARQCAAQPT